MFYTLKITFLIMVEAYIHIRVEAGRGLDVIKQLKMLPEVKEVHPVTGPYDIIAKVEVANTKALAELLVSRIHKISGIRDTTTSIVLD
ncbi:MAG: Lrp/AsnC ligand binding domain-containing protein [Candidatus Nezhaarchaeota archaeon]|nr:Lrp/AsnC ligand binding domain-containing protein [Candidatus Nezhaarchaeota archaeon]MCX8142055.1 Lrp/AsnC ligand binding domain-containing protein [Candidatus Nezhaarchaeota archaeon]MDW8050164.1 Lrp/AsnC ligand binding domain-containing protein [Nitrososphaerota archaeon]